MSPQTRAWIEAALAAAGKRPLWTLEDVVADISSGEAQLWTGQRSCMVTAITPFEGAGEKICEAWLAAGALDEIEEAIPQLEAFARANGCTQAHVTGRKGWVRALAPHGYEHWATIVRKLLT